MCLNKNRRQLPHYRDIEALLNDNEVVNTEQVDTNQSWQEYDLDDFKCKPNYPWEYDFKYEYLNDGVVGHGKNKKPDANVFWNLDEEKNSIIRLLKYKMEYTNGKAISSKFAFDCDGSGVVEKYVCALSREIYRVLWGWNDMPFPEKEIITRYGSVMPYFATSFGPDTMNSFFKIFEHYLKVKFNRFETYKSLYKTVVVNGVDINDILVDEEDRTMWEKYAIMHQTLGNFTLVPAGFNTNRSSKTNDFWDLSLLWLQNDEKNYFKKDKKLFAKYINYFFLWDYVLKEGSDYQIKSLRKNSFHCGTGVIDGHESLCLTEEEILVFLRNAVWAITRRGIFMTAMLRIEQEIGADKYGELRDNVLAVNNCYQNYGEVIEALKEGIRSLNLKEVKISIPQMSVQKIEVFLEQTKNAISEIQWSEAHQSFMVAMQNTNSCQSGQTDVLHRNE